MEKIRENNIVSRLYNIHKNIRDGHATKPRLYLPY